MKRVLALCCLAAALAPWPVAAGAGRELAAAEVAESEGLEALQLGQTETALERFSAAVGLDGESGDARYWRGVALLRLGRREEAATELAASLRARRPPLVGRAQVLADLAAAQGKPGGGAAPAAKGGAVLPEWRFDRLPIDDRGPWEGRLEIGVAEDSNANLLANELILPTPSGKLVHGAEHDSLGELGLRLGWYPRHDRAGWGLGFDLEAAQSVHGRFGYLNLGQVRGVAQLASGQDPRGFVQGPLGGTRVPFGERRFSILLQAGATYDRLNGATYLHAWEGAVAFRLPEGQATATRLDLAFADSTYSAGGLADPRRSGKELSAALAQSFFFGRADRSLTLGVRAIDRRAHLAYAGRGIEAIAALELPLAPAWSLVGQAAVRRDRYRNPESNLFLLFGPARRDTTGWGSLALAWSSSPRFRWTLRGSYGERGSNVDLGSGLPNLGYRRLVVAIGGSWSLR